MKNAYKFKTVFDLYATELWTMPEGEFLKWLNSESTETEQPEIIRCKDCKYYRWEIDMCDEPYSTAHNVVHEYDYCSRAERETDEQND